MRRGSGAGPTSILVHHKGGAVNAVLPPTYSLAFLATTCGRSIALDLTPFGMSTSTASPTTVALAILWVVGDVATYRPKHDDAVAAFVAQQAGTIAQFGDVIYERGTAEEFRTCFDSLFGPLKEWIRRAGANLKYRTHDAQPYFRYIGAAAGVPDQGWHIIVLNSNCKAADGCGPASPQYQWLEEDLATYPSLCTLAYWHNPRWSFGEHGSSAAMLAIWELRYPHGVQVVLSGHDHDYEGFQPLDAVRQPDHERGIVQFVVGIGGQSLRSLGERLPVSATGSDDTCGVLQLELYRDHFAWKFIPIPYSG